MPPSADLRHVSRTRGRILDAAGLASRYHVSDSIAGSPDRRIAAQRRVRADRQCRRSMLEQSVAAPQLANLYVLVVGRPGLHIDFEFALADPTCEGGGVDPEVRGDLLRSVFGSRFCAIRMTSSRNSRRNRSDKATSIQPGSPTRQSGSHPAVQQSRTSIQSIDGYRCRRSTTPASALFRHRVFNLDTICADGTI